jgi:c(7)-type cytochrome triheme protein
MRVAQRPVSTAGQMALVAVVAAFAAAGTRVWSAPAAAVTPTPTVRFPADRTLTDSPDSPGAVVFRHSTHFALAGNRCLACHPAPFKMLKRTFRGKHAEMDAGHACGQCHDGKRAFGTADESACATCHGAAPAADPMAAVLAIPRSADSPGPVAFDHRTHVRAAGKCSACHPRPFAAAATRKPRAAGVLHAKTACGQCHDGKGAFSVEERCDGCHLEQARR